jgi:hypothetical protein
MGKEEARTEDAEPNATDPGSSSSRTGRAVTTARPAIPRHRPLVGPALLFLVLLATSLLLLVVSSILASASLDPILNPLQWLSTLDVDAAAEIMSNNAEVVAAVLAAAVTVVAIVVQLAATRYSHEITRLFVREPVNVVVLGFLMLTAVQCVWTVAVLDESGPDAGVPHAGFAITLGMVTVSLLMLVPYIFFLFTFLSPINVIQRICRDAYRCILKAREASTPQSQRRVQDAVDQLQDVARSAIQQGDRTIALAAVDAMSNLLFDYARVRDRLPRTWFDVTESVAADADFAALAPESMQAVRAQGVWLEHKILRRYLTLMGQAANQARDVAYLIGINTRRMATELGPSHGHLLDLTVRAFNSYLRTTLNSRDPRTAYYLMHLYRMVASAMLHAGRTDRMLTIVDHLQFYGQYGYQLSMSFPLEVAAHEIFELIEDAEGLESPAVDALLDRLLDLDQEIKEDHNEESLLGVRRTQIQLATLFLMRGQRQRADRIIEDLRGERLDRLERLRANLLHEDREQYWELTDRGLNFNYLAPERRRYLADIFGALQPSPRQIDGA